MGKKHKYELAVIMREHGLSYATIAKTIYPELVAKRGLSYAKLRVNRLLYYARKEKNTSGNGIEYSDRANTDDDIEYVAGERDPTCGRAVWSFALNPRDKKLMTHDEVVRHELEALLYHLAERVMSEGERAELFNYVRVVNNKLYRIYGARASSKFYPRGLAYAYVVYHIALWARASYVVVRLRDYIQSVLAPRAVKRFKQYVKEFFAAVPAEVLV